MTPTQPHERMDPVTDHQGAIQFKKPVRFKLLVYGEGLPDEGLILECQHNVSPGDTVRFGDGLTLKYEEDGFELINS